jgi:hypothetical protein
LSEINLYQKLKDWRIKHSVQEEDGVWLPYGDSVILFNRCFNAYMQNKIDEAQLADILHRTTITTEAFSLILHEIKNLRTKLSSGISIRRVREKKSKGKVE